MLRLRPAAAEPGRRTRAREHRPRRRRRPAARHADADRREHGPDEAAGRKTPRAQHAADVAGAARDGMAAPAWSATTHPDEMGTATWTVNGWGRGRERRRPGTALVMEAGTLQQSGRADRAHDPIRALEQRGNGIAGRAGVHRGATGFAGQGRPGWIGQVSRAEMARDDPARHDDVRPRRAERRRNDAEGTAAGGGCRTSSSSRTRRWPPRARSWRGLSRSPTKKYATDYPASVGSHMTNTDSGPFMGSHSSHHAARERARRADRQRLGSAVASAD